MEVWALQLFNGISLSSILLLIALGLALSFGVMNVINLAHGEFIMIGAYTVYALQQLSQHYVDSPSAEITFLLAIPLSFLVAGAFGLLVEMTVVRFLYHRPLDTLLATLGVGIFLQQLARSIFGAPNVQVMAPVWLSGGITVMPGLVLPWSRIFIIVLVGVAILGLWWYIYRSREGRRMRAVMQDREMATSLGVSAARVDSLTFAIGSGLAGLAGCALTLIGPIGPSLGTFYIVDAFIVVILGGLGQILGTVLAALSIGMLNTIIEFGTTAVIGKVIVFAIVILFLQWRPAGLVSLKGR
jgi:urea transport system permease protein